MCSNDAGHGEQQRLRNASVCVRVCECHHCSFSAEVCVYCQRVPQCACQLQSIGVDVTATSIGVESSLELTLRTSELHSAVPKLPTIDSWSNCLLDGFLLLLLDERKQLLHMREREMWTRCRTWKVNYILPIGECEWHVLGYLQSNAGSNMSSPNWHKLHEEPTNIC